MKKKIGVIGVALAAILIFAYFPASATQGGGSGIITVHVNGSIFELWGYEIDGSNGTHLRLQDIAYILNDTPAQFDIRTPYDNRWDFWIVRNEPFTPTGTELETSFEPRYMVIGSYGFAGGYGFDGNPFQTIMLGVDGDTAPATTIAVTIIRDGDGGFFRLDDLAYLLGFSYSQNWGMGGPIIRYVDNIIITDPLMPAQISVKSPEFISLMLRLSGAWLDQAHFYSPVIDESVVWPVGFDLSQHGFANRIWTTTAPMRRIHQVMPWGTWYPISMRYLENGLVELTIDQPEQSHRAWNLHTWRGMEEPLEGGARFYNHRIVVDTRQDEITEITYYIDDVSHTMVRHDWSRNAVRHYAEPYEGGGIRVRYVTNPGAFASNDADIRVYRSTTPMIDASHPTGELIFHQYGLDIYDRILFEFIDTTAEFGMVYYYTLWRTSFFGSHFHVQTAGWRQAIRVNVNEILGEPEPLEYEEEPEVTEPDTTEELPVETPPEPPPTDPPPPTASRPPIAYEPPHSQPRGWAIAMAMILATGLIILGVAFIPD